MFILHKTKSIVQVCVQDFIRGHPNACERMKVRVWVEKAGPWCFVTKASFSYFWSSTVEYDEVIVCCWVWWGPYSLLNMTLTVGSLYLVFIKFTHIPSTHTFFESSYHERRLDFAIAIIFLPLSFILLLSCVLRWFVPAVGPSLSPAWQLNLIVACYYLVCHWILFVTIKNFYIYITRDISL